MKKKLEKEGLDLTRCEWEEIYYALESKLGAVGSGSYMIPPAANHSKEDRALLISEERRMQREWVAHLKEIIKKIGGDGARAIRLTNAEECQHEHGG